VYVCLCLIVGLQLARAPLPLCGHHRLPRRVPVRPRALVRELRLYSGEETHQTAHRAQSEDDCFAALSEPDDAANAAFGEECDY